MDMTTLAVLLSGLQQIEEKIKVVEREGFKVQVEENKNILSGVGEEKIFYFIPKDAQTPKNGYDEYIYTNNKWELVGSTDYMQLQNLPKISHNIGTDGSMTESLIGRLAFGSGIRIEKFTDSTENAFSFKVDPSKVFTVVKGNTNLDLNSAGDQPYLFAAKKYRYTNLPSFVSVGSNYDIGLLNLSGRDIGQSMQMLYWVDSNFHSHYAFRVGLSPWREIKDGSTIVSGVVNQDGTITFMDSDGNTFTTTGSSVIGPQGDDYVLTEQDKADIADIVLDKLPTVQGVLYGNANN